MFDKLNISLPLFFGVQNNAENSGLPITYPFGYSFNEKIRLYEQKSNDGLRQLLHDIYTKGSMLNGEMEAISGGHQGRAALAFIKNTIDDFNEKEVLEIGCGNGFILRKLDELGAHCIGLEPGPQIDEVNKSDNNIDIIQDFFPSKHIKNQFDVILHFNVLEHIEDPLNSLKQQLSILKKEGRIIMGIPNCEPNLLSGDISIFAHEHFNYFTRDALILMANSLNIKVENIEIGADGGMIFCSFLNETSDSNSKLLSNTNWLEFDKKIDRTLLNLKNVIKDIDTKSMAIYCPKRALNALSILNVNDCRIIDDTPDMFNMYFPYFTNRVENFNSLKENPAETIIIFSRTFGEVIKNKCLAEDSLTNSNIILLEELD